MARKTNNDHLRDIASDVGKAPSSGKVTNNELLEMISDGLGDIVVPGTGKVDATMLDGMIPAANLPSYVDDVVEAYVVGQTAYASDWLSETQGGVSLTPETGKMYVVMSGTYENTTWRWSGSAYVSLGNSLGISGAVVGQVATVASTDGNGVPTSWAATTMSRTLTVTCATLDGVTVTGQTVSVRMGDSSGLLVAQAAYEGQPVSFALPYGFEFYVSVTDDLMGHYDPSTASGTMADANVSVTLTYSDFSTVYTASDIKYLLDNNIDLTNLVGEEITCTKGGNTLTWVVGDYDTSGVVTLFMIDCSAFSADLVFEPPQAIAYFNDGLSAGSYKFTSSSTYYLTLATAIPAGGQLSVTTSTFATYASQSDTTALETGTVTTTEISGATSLGTAGSSSGTYALNDMNRASYGSNNYGESAIHWLLNTDATAGTIRTPVTKFSRAYSYSKDGFLKDLDASFLSCVDEVDWKCAASTSYECPASMGGISTKSQSYTVRAKFCLMSNKEVFGSTIGTDAGDAQMDVFVDSTANDRKMYRGTTAKTWWLRTPNQGVSYRMRTVNILGSSDVNYPQETAAVVPACKICKTQDDAN